ncbi:MAG: aminoacyl-tRNA hydrolase [Bacteroidales bacterium]|jgi:PTH1 family peptidyl-tRNA hydrolase|nr:aminoacyl-tRNA hydrolase [Bacteroidales bacterium]
MKYLIVGLGNIGLEYENTRHNIGFMALDHFVDKQEDCKFSSERYAFVAKTKHKGRQIILIKPTTYMNLSGKAVRYWMIKENIPEENILIIVDDIALPLSTIRLRKSGSDGGHNGLKDIISSLGNSNFNRLRFGIGDAFSQGRQVDYVLGKFSQEEAKVVNEKLETIDEIIKSFSVNGMERTMNMYNGK